MYEKTIATYYKIKQGTEIEENIKEGFLELFMAHAELLEKYEQLFDYSNTILHDNIKLRKEFNKPSFHDELSLH